MKLRRVLLEMKSGLRDMPYASHFDFHTYFIGYYLSMQVRKLKFETDGTFDSIIIEVGKESPSVERHFLNNLIANLPFDFEFYDNATQTQKYDYYLELIHEGLQLASEHKNIPLAELENLITSLVDNNFIYTWKFKNIRVPEYNLKIKFTCQLGTDDFIIRMVALRNKVSEPVCEGVVIRTIPDYIFFGDVPKNIQIKNDRICFFDRFGREGLTIGLRNIIEGNLIIDYSESPYPDNPERTRLFKHFQETFRYDNNDFIAESY